MRAAASRGPGSSRRNLDDLEFHSRRVGCCDPSMHAHRFSGERFELRMILDCKRLMGRRRRLQLITAMVVALQRAADMELDLAQALSGAVNGCPQLSGSDASARLEPKRVHLR